MTLLFSALEIAFVYLRSILRRISSGYFLFKTFKATSNSTDGLLLLCKLKPKKRSDSFVKKKTVDMILISHERVPNKVLDPLR